MLIIKKNFSKSSLLILDKLDRSIKFKRIFFLIAKKKTMRGDHAHKKCIQAFFSVKGSFYLESIDRYGRKKKFIIKPGKKILLIKPHTWVKIFLKENDICGVLCDRYYEKKDYITNYKKFNATKNNI